MISVVDSGVANLASVMAALERLNVKAEVTSDAELIGQSSHVIIPGVGAASPAMALLENKKLVTVLQKLTQPILGICLGMQLLYERSEEGEGTECLGVIPGAIEHMTASKDTPVPHMGWNNLLIKDQNHPLMKNVPQNSFVYFVHSFAAPVSSSTLVTTAYGSEFTSVVTYKNFFGCQFHPERSGPVGSLILKNFLDM